MHHDVSGMVKKKGFKHFGFDKGLAGEDRDTEGKIKVAEKGLGPADDPRAEGRRNDVAITDRGL